MNDLEKLISLCKAGVYVTVNQHKDLYLTVEKHLSEESSCFPGAPLKEILNDHDITESEFNKMVSNNSIVSIQFYPHTPVGFYNVLRSNLSDCVKSCLDIMDDLK